jgi:hypothetical protein
MTNNNIWDCADMRPMISAEWSIQGDFESCADILVTSYWLHVKLGKNI